MKRTGNLYEQICSMDNLRLAHKHAKAHKTWYKEVQEVEENLEENLKSSHDMLVNKTYKTSE